MKHKFDWLLVVLCTLGYLMIITSTLSIAYRIDYTVGILVSGGFLCYFSSKLLNRNRL